MKHIITLLLLTVSLAFAGCKPTVEGESARYTASKDRLEALGTKNPTMKADIQAKIAEFEVAKTAAESKTGEAKAAALRELNNRISAYEATLAPATPDGGTSDGGTPDGPVLGSKLGDAGTTVTPDAAGGKLGGTGSGSAGSGSAGSGSAGSGSAGSGSAGSGSGSSKSGFGPQPDPAPSKSGFGGK